MFVVWICRCWCLNCDYRCVNVYHKNACFFCLANQTGTYFCTWTICSYTICVHCSRFEAMVGCVSCVVHYSAEAVPLQWRRSLSRAAWLAESLLLLVRTVKWKVDLGEHQEQRLSWWRAFFWSPKILDLGNFIKKLVGKHPSSTKNSRLGSPIDHKSQVVAGLQLRPFGPRGEVRKIPALVQRGEGPVVRSGHKSGCSELSYYVYIYFCWCCLFVKRFCNIYYIY